MASWGFCLLVFDSSREPANRPEEMVCAVPGSVQPNLYWGALRPMRRLLALRRVHPWKFRQVCCIVGLCVGKLGTISCFANFQVHLVLLNVSPELAMCRQKQK